MANLYFKDGKWWVNYRISGKRYRRSTGTADRELAEVKLKDLEVKLFKGQPAEEIQKPETTLSDFFARFIEYSKNAYSPRHLQSDLSRIQILRDFFARKGIREIRSITPGIYEEFETVVLKGRKPKTKKNYLLLLKTMLNYAVKWGLVDKNPLTDVKSPKVVKTFQFFSKDEIFKIVENADEPLRTGVLFLVNTGLRREEFFNLRWRDVDLKAKKLRVWPYEGFIPKGKRPRSIPLNKTVLDILKNLKKRDGNNEFVFRPFNSMYPLYERFKALLGRLGLEGRLHDLRHTFASHLSMAGVPIPVISELLGHSDISTTMIYAHLAPDQHAPAVEKLEF